MRFLRPRRSLALLVLVVGCSPTTRPVTDAVPRATHRVISGVVRYPGGAPEPRARVSVNRGAPSIADDAGHYVIVAPGRSRTVTLTAWDGYAPGRAYAETSSGSVTVVLGKNGATRDIVLDHSTPI